MFASAEESHAHSRETLERFADHLEFIKSIKTVSLYTIKAPV